MEGMASIKPEASRSLSNAGDTPVMVQRRPELLLYNEGGKTFDTKVPLGTYKIRQGWKTSDPLSAPHAEVEVLLTCRTGFEGVSA